MSGKYAFIDAEYTALAREEAYAPTIARLCEWLEVSKSGYYDWRSRPQSAAAKRRKLLELKIKALFEANNAEYGYRRIHAELVRGGETVDDETVRKIMRYLGLEPCQPKPWRHSLTEQDGQAGPIPDLVNRDFTADKPGQKMVGDITYIDSWEGWVYLATVIDCATRKIVGWAMDDNYKTPLISSDRNNTGSRRRKAEGTHRHTGTEPDSHKRTGKARSPEEEPHKPLPDHSLEADHRGLPDRSLDHNLAPYGGPAGPHSTESPQLLAQKLAAPSPG